MSALRKVPALVWHLLTVTLLGLPLLTPLWKWTAVACTHDGHLHYHRVAAMRHAWEHGLYLSRWLPDLAFGYGYPFFVYREPTPLYAVLLPHLLGLPLPAAENLFYALCILAAGWFMFLWVRDVFGARAGIVSAVAYMSAPYVLVDVLIRGNAPESLALPLMPFLLWAGRRWLLTGKVRWFVTAVLGLAFFSLSHNISLLLFTPVLLVYLGVLTVLYKVGWRTAVTRIALIFILGLGMTIFYSGGALLEMDAVTLQQSTSTRNNDFHYNFATLAEIFSPVQPEDPTLINPPLLFRLGWVTTGLAILGALSWFVLRRLEIRDWRLDEGEQSPISNLQSLKEKKWHIVLMVLATAVFLFMSLPASLFIWENMPLIDFVQFPWRFVGRAALPMAMLAGVPFGVASGKLQVTKYGIRNTEYLLRIFFFFAIVLLIIEAIPNLYPHECREEPYPTILTVFDYEHETGLVGVDPEGSYFPRTVQQRPTHSPLEADYAAGQMPQRWDETVMPEGAVVKTAVTTPLSTQIQLTGPKSFTAHYLAFAFPGWQVKVDGESVPITPSDPDGLITFPIPAGTHTVEVKWGSTPLRTGLAAVSLLAFLGFVGVVIFGHRSSVIDHLFLPPPAICLRPTDIFLLIILALILLGLKLAVDRTDNPLYRASEPEVAVTAVLQTSELHLDGFNLSHTRVTSGGVFDVDMAWTAVDNPRASYQTNVWLVGPNGLVWSEKETFRPRLYEDAPLTIFWQPGQWAWDSREVQTLPGTPPGEYDLVLTLFDRETLQPMTLLDEAGQVVGPTAVLDQITITPADEHPQFKPQYPLTADLSAPRLRLLGYNLDRRKAAPGDPFLLTLFWEQTGRPFTLSSVPLSLLHDGHEFISWKLDVTSVEQGGRVRSQHLLHFPASLESGPYQLALDGDIAMTNVTIQAPDRIYERPDVATAVNIPFSLNGINLTTLTGYTISNLQSPISLIWQANAEFPASYRVFIHLVDEAGQIVAQSDGEPANWTRPTTGWATGEFIVDEHRLTLSETAPDGPLFLRVGLYDPATGIRLQTETAAYVEIPFPR